jgi:hypothetical protein
MLAPKIIRRGKTGAPEMTASDTAVRLVLLALWSCACASNSAAPQPEPAPAPVAPDWVKRGSGLFEDQGKKTIFGFGQAQPGPQTNTRNPALLRVTSDNQAVGEVVRNLEALSARFRRGYMATPLANEKYSQVPSEECISYSQPMMWRGWLYESAAKAIQIVDHWLEDTHFYSLAEADLDAWIAEIRKLKEIDPDFVQYIRDHAQRIFAAAAAEQDQKR